MNEYTQIFLEAYGDSVFERNMSTIESEISDLTVTTEGAMDKIKEVAQALCKKIREWIKKFIDFLVRIRNYIAKKFRAIKDKLTGKNKVEKLIDTDNAKKALDAGIKALSNSKNKEDVKDAITLIHEVNGKRVETKITGEMLDKKLQQSIEVAKLGEKANAAADAYIKNTGDLQLAKEFQVASYNMLKAMGADDKKLSNLFMSYEEFEEKFNNNEPLEL